MPSSRVSLLSRQAPQVRAPGGLVNLIHKTKTRGRILTRVEKGQGREIKSVSLEQADEEPRDFWEVCSEISTLRAYRIVMKFTVYFRLELDLMFSIFFLAGGKVERFRGDLKPCVAGICCSSGSSGSVCSADIQSGCRYIFG
jgi:hypothetical protein